MTPSILDYHSTTPTYALAFSPLSKTTPSLAIGSYVESSFTSENHVTVIGLDESYLEYEDDSSSSSNDDDDDDDDGQREEEDEDEIMSDPTPARPSSPLPLSARTKTGSKILLGSAFVSLARAPHSYPPSAVAFSPEQLSSSLQASNGGTKGEGTREMVASSSDCLRLWDLRGQGEESVSGGRKRTTNLSSNYVGERGRGRNGTGMELIPRAVLANSKTEYSAPLTSFSWSAMEPTHIVTSSIDTTCTVWDIATSVPITQLIAHDREVYDVAWSPATRDVFASVGADGSVRMFDLRALEHSTILYEASPPSPSSTSSSASSSSPVIPTPLLRLAFSPTAPTYLSVCHADSKEVQILDTRSPGTPAMEVRGHKASVNGMAWGGATMSSRNNHGSSSSGPGCLATVGEGIADDSTLLLWDLSNSSSKMITPPLPAPLAPPSSSSRGTTSTTKTASNGIMTTKIIKDPIMAYTAPSEINAVAWSFGNTSHGSGGDWVAIGCGRLVRCLRA